MYKRLPSALLRGPQSSAVSILHLKAGGVVAKCWEAAGPDTDATCATLHDLDMLTPNAV